MPEWINNTVSDLGYPGIVLLMFLENVFFFIPSEVIISLAGFMTTQGKFSFVGVVVSGMVGSVLGSLPFYYLGKFAGCERLKAWADAYGKWFTVSGEEIDRADKWFDRHGNKAVFFCRLIPGIRSFISIPAGFSDMRLSTFLLYTALGTGLWAAVLAYLGRLLGRNYDKVERYMKPALYIVLAAILVACIIWIARRKRRRALMG